MKKSMLCAGLMAFLSMTTYAENSASPVNVNTNTGPTPPNVQNGKEQNTGVIGAEASDSSTNPPAQKAQNPTNENSQDPTVTGTLKPTPAATGTTPTSPGSQTPSAAAAAPQPLDCNYHIPAETTHIEQTIVLKWAEKAAEQSFNLDHGKLNTQLSSLKACYTEQGWQGFNDALQKSDNLNAIKTQQLMVSSMVNGKGVVTEIKDNQWKVSIPMQVVYQNNREKLTQPLTVNLVVGRKISGDLGIMQMIAIPPQSGTTSKANDAASGTPTTSEVTNPAPHQ